MTPYQLRVAVVVSREAAGSEQLWEMADWHARSERPYDEAIYREAARLREAADAAKGERP